MRRLILCAGVLALALGVGPVAGSGRAPAPQAAAMEPGRAGDEVLLIASYPKGITVRVGDAADVCLAPGGRATALSVVAVSCTAGRPQCAAFVRLPRRKALPVLAGYRADAPPKIVEAGGAC